MTTNNPLSVFISYARADASSFAQELMLGLEVAGFQAFLDRHDIAAGEEWEARLGSLIDASDTIVFIITPASARSARCLWEVEQAESRSKRVIPVVWAGVPESELPDQLKRRNFIFFNDGHSFAQSLSALAHALRVDLYWIREHTRFANLAGRWEERDRNESLLLRGQELSSAVEWLSSWRAPAPEPTRSQRDFIGESEATQNRLRSAERKRARRTIFALILVAAVFAGLSVMSTVLWRSASLSEEKAILAAKDAQEQRDVAKANEDSARTAELHSRNIAAQALWHEGMYWLQTARISRIGLKADYHDRAQIAFQLGLDTLRDVPKASHPTFDDEPLVDLLTYGRALTVSCSGASVQIEMSAAQIQRIKGYFDDVRMEGCTL
jgi:hypothetical protein